MKDRQRVVITGSRGLLGKNIIEQIGSSMQIFAVTREVPAFKSEDFTYIPIDLSKNWDAKDLPKDIDVIVHLAQSDKFKNFPSDALEVFNVNLTSTSKLLDFASRSGVKKFILASTGGIYRRDNSPLNSDSEIEAPDQLSQYFGTKLASEIFANNYKGIFDVDILRFFFIYGPNQKSHMLIPRLIINISDGVPVTLSGEDGISINPIFVTDAANVVRKRISKETSEVINVCGKEIVTIREVSEIIGEVLGKKPIFKHVPKAEDLIADYKRTSEHLQGNFISLREGLKNVIKEMKII